jgi:pimeloyl-ACP methyl ester carboxylesterase
MTSSVASSGEKFIQANGIEICYETFGDASHPTILFVMGYGAQMLAWPDALHEGLVDAGFHVVRYDNRDVGLSQKIDEAGNPDLGTLLRALSEGKKPDAPYFLSDMAADGIGLLDALGIDRAHVVGASMGGMIVQQMAIDAGGRLSSMTSIMSTTGDTSVPPATDDAITALQTPAPADADMDALVDFSMKNREVIGGDGFTDDQETRDNTRAMLERQIHPEGRARQYAAILASGPRTEALKSVTTPTLVIHGSKDPLVPVEGGIHTAEVIDGARLEILEGMGHAMYPVYQPRILELIQSFAQANK